MQKNSQPLLHALRRGRPLGKVKEQHFRRSMGGQVDLLLFADAGAVPRAQRLAVQLHAATGQVEVSLPAGRKHMLDRLPFPEASDVEESILVDCEGACAGVGRGHQAQAVCRLDLRKFFCS